MNVSICVCVYVCMYACILIEIIKEILWDYSFKNDHTIPKTVHSIELEVQFVVNLELSPAKQIQTGTNRNARTSAQTK